MRAHERAKARDEGARRGRDEGAQEHTNKVRDEARTQTRSPQAHIGARDEGHDETHVFRACEKCPYSRVPRSLSCATCACSPYAPGLTAAAACGRACVGGGERISPEARDGKSAARPLALSLAFAHARRVALALTTRRTSAQVRRVHARARARAPLSLFLELTRASGRRSGCWALATSTASRRPASAARRPAPAAEPATYVARTHARAHAAPSASPRTDSELTCAWQRLGGYGGGNACTSPRPSRRWCWAFSA